MRALLILIVILAVGIVGYFFYGTEDLPTDTVNQQSVTSGDNPLPGSTVHDLPIEPAARKARTALSGALGIAETSILVLSVYEREWSDSCLGVEGPNEFCAQVITPGFEVTLRAAGKEYVYHTNSDGSSVRRVP